MLRTPKILDGSSGLRKSVPRVFEDSSEQKSPRRLHAGRRISCICVFLQSRQPPAECNHDRRIGSGICYAQVLPLKLSHPGTDPDVTSKARAVIVPSLSQVTCPQTMQEQATDAPVLLLHAC